MSGLWIRDPSSLIPPTNNKRVIGRKPLLDLRALQTLVTSGRLGEDEVWVATASCERDLQNYRWDFADVLHMLSCLSSKDFKNSEWCQVKGGEIYPCDTYRFHYDCERRARNPRGLEVYMKFSVTEDNQLSLVLVSCHGSR